MWIEDGKKIEKYSGSRSHDDLKAYVEKMLGTAPSKSEKNESAEEVSPVVQLTGLNFEHATEAGVTFVKFFAPWCGHCKVENFSFYQSNEFKKYIFLILALGSSVA